MYKDKCNFANLNFYKEISTATPSGRLDRKPIKSGRGMSINFFRSSAMKIYNKNCVEMLLGQCDAIGSKQVQTDSFHKPTSDKLHVLSSSEQIIFFLLSTDDKSGSLHN